MAATNRLGCDRCGYEVTTSGPRRMTDGRMVARLYCATCGVTRECESGATEPRRGPLGVPLGPRGGRAARLAGEIARRLRSGVAAGAANCPTCGDGDLVLVQQAGREPRCPHCGEGRLRLWGE
ncbi:MAG: hypothetical protein AVDCRST_MAG18-2015 [uncultured Thermomicrobiales bacterium]|uniref:Uncharacterized protein n=1 Tax=uncultured Thermomicrobiales bacterium TaxID=1645740 RepID=A0A6J4VAB0_9BACT|nr:MAG: hypothetical protein AVDCRST_MAG18-2015 [uncultured Thermomicrobiales bacterium]